MHQTYEFPRSGFLCHDALFPCAVCCACRARAVFLHVMYDNINALDFYVHHGFKVSINNLLLISSSGAGAAVVSKMVG